MTANHTMLTALVLAGGFLLTGGADLARGQSCLAFGNLKPLNANAASDSSDDADSKVTTDGQGNWVTVWASNENLGGTIGIDSDILVSRSTDSGRTWTAPEALNANAATDTGGD